MLDFNQITDLTKEKADLVRKIDQLILDNRELKFMNAELDHKLEIQKMLQEQFKEFVRTNIDVFDFEKF